MEGGVPPERRVNAGERLEGRAHLIVVGWIGEIMHDGVRTEILDQQRVAAFRRAEVEGDIPRDEELQEGREPIDDPRRGRTQLPGTARVEIGAEVRRDR